MNKIYSEVSTEWHIKLIDLASLLVIFKAAFVQYFKD